MQNFSADIAVIGGGAAGLTAAVAAARQCENRGKSARVLLLEQGPRVGKKLLATGNGRCNLTNAHISSEAYHSLSPSGFPRLLSSFRSGQALDFFARLGLLCRTEEAGRIYPYSGQASTVLDLLRQSCASLGVEECCGFPVEKLRRTKTGFLISSPEKSCAARAVILATGGRAAPSPGGGTEGYALLSALGHSVTPLFPALAPVKSDPALTRALKGVRCRCAVTLLADGRTVKTETGELQFTETGLSGVCIFQLSRYAGEYQTLHTVNGRPCRVLECAVDLFPSFVAGSLEELLCAGAAGNPLFSTEQLLCGLLHKRIAQCVLKSLSLPGDRPAGRLDSAAVKTLARHMKDWRFPVRGVLPWQNAQVTAGGVPLAEFDPLTLESRCAPGLYAAGEVLDVDGDCGGFNLHWAWSSGIRAGESAAGRLLSAAR